MSGVVCGLIELPSSQCSESSLVLGSPSYDDLFGAKPSII